MANKIIDNIENTSYIVRKRGLHEGRRLSGKTIKTYCGIRIEKHIKDKIIDEYKSVQKWIDRKVQQEFHQDL